ncbi:radical SAM protein [Clostridium butyricum]|uniref:radical SAM protein n=1 Tax=Clostridium butyricum TaxID=1492 RepID=UPI002AB03BB3|nr:radical SAM protein [Clostridium butyricum]
MNRNFIIKAHLLYGGIKISSAAKKLLDSMSEIWLMDDYITCSGVTLVFGDEYATAAPDENSKFELDAVDGKFVIIDDEGNTIDADVITPPDYMKDEIIIDNKPITCYVNTYTDRVRIQLLGGCANTCKFCNAKEFNYEFNSLEGLDEALQIALSQSKVRHGLLSSGNAKYGQDLKRLTEMYKFFCQKYKDLEIDLMTPPRGFESYTASGEYKEYVKYLKEIGIYGLSVNIELNNPEQLKFYCPEKAMIGQKNYLDFIEAGVEVFGKNKVRSLLIVGLEPLEETLKGVEKLAQRGCNPVLSPLFPYAEATGNPSAELFIEAKAKSEEICDKYGVKMGPLCRPCNHNTL